MFSASKTAGPSGYNISRSVRIRQSASAYLSRTPAASGNLTTWTWSGWVKRGSLSATKMIFSYLYYNATGPVNNQLYLIFNSTDQLKFQQANQSGTIGSLTTNAVYRDPSAWYHIVAVWNTSDATSSNRMKLYVNGVQITSFASSTYPAQNTTSYWNTNGVQTIGAQYDAGLGFQVGFDGYLTEINFIDGQALTPSSFGSTNATTGVWQPAKYTGTYGTNGFYLNFSDNSAATAAAIGKDYSGNGNNWTPNNISVTAGVTYDSMIDVPTPYADGSTNRGNYCTLNPLAASSNITTNSANLACTSGAASYNAILGTMSPPSGKWYFEMTLTGSVAAPDVGFHQAAYTSSQLTAFTSSTRLGGYCIATDGTGTSATYAFNNGTQTTLANSGWSTNDVIGCAIDVDNKKIWFSRNGTWYPASVGGAAGDPANGTNPAITYTYTDALLPRTSAYSGGYTPAVNFGQRPFTYTPPSGFKALNTYNLPASTITNGGKYMAATLYTGTLLSNSITNAGGFKPDLVWVKSRSAATDHKLTDSVRGVTKALISDTTGAETTDTQGLTAFNSNGFTVGTDTNYNNLSATYVGWQWQAGQGSTSSNTSGSITSTVSVNATAGFSVVTYTGTGANATVGHGLGVAPAMMICKIRNSVSTENWYVWHQSIPGSTPYIYLNLTNAAVTGDSTRWTAAPSSTVINLGNNSACNGNTGTYVTYCWAQVAGFSKFGSYTGNGSADGPFVYCGFRPKFVLVKRTDLTNDWFIVDTSRDTYNISSALLRPNTSAAEQTSGVIDVLSNGFKPRTTDSAYNASGGTYIYAAFAENPFANALAR